MKKHIIILFCLFTALQTQAQTVVTKADNKNATLSLRNGSTLTYTPEQYDSIRVVANLTLTSGYGVKVYLTGDLKSHDYLVASYQFTTESGGGGGDTDGNANRNSLSSYYNASKQMYNLEWPRIRDNANQSWLIRECDGMTSYQVEWDNSLIANRFTCYQMYDKIATQNVPRKDDFKEDTELPASTRSTLDDYKSSGFSRGHLCPSADRRYSTEMSKQTCLLSNIQPQIQYHNGGQWSVLEGKVRTWTTSFDTLYVVKAATIENVTINGVTQSGVKSELCNNRLLVPKYFYMALMGYKKSTDTYTAVGIWTYHSTQESEKTEEYITIDELERRTGIDFFCNLPDDVEEAVESTVASGVWE